MRDEGWGMRDWGWWSWGGVASAVGVLRSRQAGAEGVDDLLLECAVQAFGGRLRPDGRDAEQPESGLGRGDVACLDPGAAVSLGGVADVHDDGVGRRRASLAGRVAHDVEAE